MIQPARHECHACCPLQAEKPGIQPVVGNTHDTHVEQVVSSFQKILRGLQLTWYKHRDNDCTQWCDLDSDSPALSHRDCRTLSYVSRIDHLLGILNEHE